MGCAIGQNSLFGASNNYIKFNGGDLIAIEGPNTVERQMLSDLRFNYKQLLRGRVILKPGQVNYLMNHLGLGDNATFVSLAARYDAKSKIEEDNYINWSFYDDLSKIYSMGQYMCLTGNSTNRIKQIYLSNPNSQYSVTVDVMVAVLDDSYNFFTDITNQSGTSFVNLRYTDLQSFVIGESIKFVDSQGRALVYIILNNINSIEINGKILIIDDDSLGRILVQFVTEFDARQANSVLNYVLDNENVDISLLTSDEIPPILYWYSNVNNTGTASFITLNGVTDNIPYDTTDGFTFSTSISLLQFGGPSQSLSKQNLIDLLIDKVVDNRDGTMSISTGNIVLTGTQGEVNSIVGAGPYKMKFLISDIAGNDLSKTEMQLNIIDKDIIPPVIFWKKTINNDDDQPIISFMGATSGAPYNTLIGKTFSTSIVFPQFQIGGEISKDRLVELTIDKVVDEIDGELQIVGENLILTDSNGVGVYTIFETGNYSMTFNLTDTAENSLYGIYLNFEVVTQLPDVAPPVIYWFTTVGDLPLTAPIECDGRDISEGTFNTTDGDVFRTSLSFASFSTDSMITKMDLNNLLIDYVYDERDGYITLTSSNISLGEINETVVPIDNITLPGFYSMTFSLSDIANNNLQNIIMIVEVTE
jgi:hypothetical protein